MRIGVFARERRRDDASCARRRRRGLGRRGPSRDGRPDRRSLALPDENLRDAAIGLGGDVVRDLFRFDDEQNVAGLDGVAGRHAP